MRIKLLLFSLLLSFLFGQKAYADNFIVISNADSGPGTLRDAVTKANGNGTAVFDTILFDIANLSRAGRTITLQTELPTLSSKIVIDGSSQPGPVFGLSTAKVILFLGHYPQQGSFNFLHIENASYVSIYGLCFEFFGNPDAAGGLNYGILLFNCSNITIGAPNKGNLFSAIRTAITNLHWNAVNNSLKDITIQSNVFGLGPENERTLRGSIHIIISGNIKIGGESPDEGNLFVGSHVYVSQTEAKTDYFAKVQNNRFNVNWNGTQYFNESGSMELWGNLTDDLLPAKTFVTNNIMSSFDGGIGLYQLSHRVLVQGNKLGTDITGTTCKGYRNDIGVQSSKNIIIGGYLPAEENFIAGNIYTPHHGVHVIKNKLGGDIWNNGVPPNDPFIKIITYDAGLITGIANQNAKIQLYYLTCSDQCMKKEYLTTVFANASGNWSFPYSPAMPNVIATSTMADSSTSAFSSPKISHNNSVVTLATCGKSNGSVSGIKILEGTHIRWVNANTREIVGTDTNLINVPAGRYDLMVYNGINGCPYVQSFIVDDIQPAPFLNPQPYIIDATCGQSNGVINAYSQSYPSVWLNANHDSVGTGPYLNNALPGTYYLKAWIAHDTSCNRIYGPFVIKNNSGPTLRVNTMQISPATCGEFNGSIKNISASNVTGTPFIQWQDSLGIPVGSSFNLLNVKPGKYQLKFKDEGTCDTITTPFFIVPNQGTITIDDTNLEIRPAGCTINNGSIRNIRVTGAANFQWKKVGINANAGNNSDIFDLSPGIYQLTVSNSFGCMLTSSIINVAQAQFAPITTQQVTVKNGNCGENNGDITIGSLTNSAALLSHHWINSSTNQIIGTGLALPGLGPGTYEFVAVDTNGCQQTIFTQPIIVNPKPSLNTSGVIIKDDECSLQKGSITGLQINGLQGPTTYTWFNTNNLVVGNSQNLSNVGSGGYRLMVNDNGDCIIESGIFAVNNDDNAGIPPLFDDVMIPRNTETSLVVKNPRQGTYILYNDAAGTQVHQQNSTGIFTTGILTSDKDFYIRHVSGSCSSSLTKVKVTVVDKSIFAIPTAFTPNNDGLNDKLTLKVIGQIEVEYFKVYNRNGELVFSTKTINNGWDGRLKGVDQPSGAYVWMAKGKDITGKRINDKGSFVLIR